MSVGKTSMSKASAATGQGLTHEQAAEQHVARRLFQRHAVAITRSEYRSLNAAIAQGEHPSLGPTRRAGGTLHLVEIHGRLAYVVFSPTEQIVVTVLPGHPDELRGAA